MQLIPCRAPFSHLSPSLYMQYAILLEAKDAEGNIYYLLATHRRFTLLEYATFKPCISKPYGFEIYKLDLATTTEGDVLDMDKQDSQLLLAANYHTEASCDGKFRLGCINLFWCGDHGSCCPSGYNALPPASLSTAVSYTVTILMPSRSYELTKKDGKRVAYVPYSMCGFLCCICAFPCRPRSYVITENETKVHIQKPFCRRFCSTFWNTYADGRELSATAADSVRVRL